MIAKRIGAALLAVAVALACAGCGAKEAPAGSVTGSAEGFPWTIELRAAKLCDALHTAAGVPQYDGGTLDVDYDDAPRAGCMFLILTFTITKTEAGGDAFEWDRLRVRGADGESYPRMEDDSFIQNHTYNRIAGTPLKIGENRGSACFEIPEAAAKGDLTLTYDAGEAGTIEMPVRPERD